ncbi:plant expansin [Pyrrhoderma noxium]|uniref:Plant expansin n=1 Tax=Pyrrhoderma noxium TaxID=2282107 RepID=A0A286USC2_9AGAM|nr:plant expansin [Pyrrhoderma noxium]
MLALSKLVVVALAFSAQSAFAAHRSFGRRHHDIAVRNAEVVPPVQAFDDNVKTVRPRRRRSDSSRCKASSSSASSSFDIASSTFSSEEQQATSAVVVNVGGNPDTTSSTQEAQPTTQEAQPTTSSFTQEAQQTSSSSSKKQEATSTQKETTQQAATSTSSAASATGTQSYLSGTQTGEGTYYSTGLGACGITNSDSDYIAAVSYLLFDTYPGYDGTNSNDNPLCGKSVTATYGGKSVTVQITDRCTGCALTDLDFSPSAFTQLADESVGRITGMTWVWS